MTRIDLHPLPEAIALIGHSDVNVYHLPADAEWPGKPDEVISLARGCPCAERRRSTGHLTPQFVAAR